MSTSPDFVDLLGAEYVPAFDTLESAVEFVITEIEEPSVIEYKKKCEAAVEANILTIAEHECDKYCDYDENYGSCPNYSDTTRWPPQLNNDYMPLSLHTTVGYNYYAHHLSFIDDKTNIYGQHKDKSFGIGFEAFEIVQGDSHTQVTMDGIAARLGKLGARTDNVFGLISPFIKGIDEAQKAIALGGNNSDESYSILGLARNINGILDTEELDREIQYFSKLYGILSSLALESSEAINLQKEIDQIVNISIAVDTETLQLGSSVMYDYLRHVYNPIR